jgi:hypothetical protein
MNYPKETPAPGSFDHRSGDCDRHGVNVVFAKPKGSQQPPFCVRCAQEVYEKHLRPNPAVALESSF